MNIDISLDKIKDYIGVWLPLWGLIAFVFTYEASLVKQDQFYEKDLDSRIARTEILIAVYERDPSTLSEEQRNKYERAKGILSSLEDKRLELEENQ